ncbi:hypothetical protein GMLC_41770 [Geomonas limicola]|uniref:Uncharacterized protein n=2 Tax=Geomonas TaxID=2651583 RepID=A0A6V8MPN4_9BACT|nr:MULTISPECIES: hypothetical protein [Geomonas]GFO62015.1 hypothetical protein GMST_43400 [Geomonas silvestris]GFO70598.1 hypothetical protein GMLC_41770 [Geomonas limicola]
MQFLNRKEDLAACLDEIAKMCESLTYNERVSTIEQSAANVAKKGIAALYIFISAVFQFDLRLTEDFLMDRYPNHYSKHRSLKALVPSAPYSGASGF